MTDRRILDMRRLTMMMAVAMVLICHTAAGRAKRISFAPDTVTVLRNPLCGWVMYLGRSWDSDFWEKQGYDEMPASDGTVVKVSDYAGTAYIRTSWASLEPEEGVYAWRDTSSRISRLFRTVQDRGMRLALRIVVDGRDQGQNTPMYVIDAGAEYFTSGKGEHKSPYCDDPVFQEKYARFIEAMAEDFNDVDMMDFIDAFGLGKWGESHAMVFKDPSRKEAVVDWVTSLYARTFTNIPLFIHYHRMLADSNQDSWGEVPDGVTELLENVIVEKGYSIRHDAFGMTGYYMEWEKDFCRRWNNRRPVIMEGGWITAAHHRYWLDPCGKYREGHSEDVRLGEFEAAREAKVNMMDFRINDETRSWFGKCFTLVKRFVAEGGYRLYPDMLRLPSAVKSTGKARVEHRWNNMGWGYFPNNIPQWNYRYKVAFALLDARGDAVKTFVTDAEPSGWLKGQPAVYASEFSMDGVPVGRYVWAVAIVDTTKGNVPGIYLAIENAETTCDGWTKLSCVTVK